MVVKAFVLIRVGVGTVGVGRVGGVGDGDSDGIIINGSLKRIRFRELIVYIRVSCV